MSHALQKGKARAILRQLNSTVMSLINVNYPEGIQSTIQIFDTHNKITYLWR
jgi:hypothetical protein